MSVKFYRRSNNTYYGAFDEAEAPEDAIEVEIPPTHAAQTWNGTTWTGYEPPQPHVLTGLIAQAYAQGDPDVPWEMFTFLDAIRFGAHSPSLRQAVWARLKSEGLPWVTPGLKDKMIAWAIQANCPLE